MRLTLLENHRFLLYAPFYAAHAIGAYAAEGLEVSLQPSPGIGRAEAALVEGAVDVMWAGPMRVMKHHDAHPQSPLVCFAEIVCRDPFSIIGAEKRPDFRLADLVGLRFATVAEVPTPWLCLQQDLREAGIDPERLDRVGDRSMADNLAALQRGEIAAMQCFEPVVEQALAAGATHLWQAASSRGRTTYTAFVATRQGLAANSEAMPRMVRAIHRTQQWVHSHSAGELAAAITEFFPTLDCGVMTRALARYAEQGVWGRDPLLPEAGFARLHDALLGSGFIRAAIPYEACVDPRIALQVIGNS